MKKAVLVVVSVLVLCLSAQAALGSTGIGGRAMGMGGAFTAVADDGTATYWNPAGLTQVKFSLAPTFGAVGDWKKVYDMMDEVEAAVEAETYDDLSIDETAFDLNLGTGLNFSRVALNLYSNLSLYTHGADAKKADLRANLPLNFALTYAQKFTDELGVGINLKYIYLARGVIDYEEEDTQLVDSLDRKVVVPVPSGEIKALYGSGFALDLGGLFQVSDEVRVGAVLRNIPLGEIKMEGEKSGTDLTALTEEWENYAGDADGFKEEIEAGEIPVPIKTQDDYTEKYTLPTVLVVGGAYKVPATGTLIAADYEIPFSDEEKSFIHLGLEQPIFGAVFLRVGGYTANNDLRLTAGLGGKLGPVLLDLAAVQGEESVGMFLTGGFRF